MVQLIRPRPNDLSQQVKLDLTNPQMQRSHVNPVAPQKRVTEPGRLPLFRK